MFKKIRLILSSVRQYKVYAIVTPIFMIGEALIECLLPALMSLFLNATESVHSVADMADMSLIPTAFGFSISMNLLIIALVVGSFLSLFFGIMGGRFAAKASVGLATNLRSDLYKKIQTFSFANIDKFQTSSLVTRLTTDVQNVSMAFQMCIRIVVRAPLMMIFSAGMAFISGGQISFVFIGLVFVVAICMVLIILAAMKIFTKVFKRYDKLNESIQENVSGMRVVKSYVREDFEKEKFNTASTSMSNEFIKAEKIVALNNPVMNTSIHLSNIIVVGLGTYLIVKSYNPTNSKVLPDGTVSLAFDGLSISDLSSLLTYGIMILTSVLMVSIIMVMLSMSLEAVRRIGEVMEEEPTIKNPDNPIYEVADGSVDFDNVNFKYFQSAEKNTLENINIHIKSGQFIGILGSTGSGKTSLVNLISRLYDISPNEQELEQYGLKVGGVDVKKYDLTVLRDSVAVVLQKNVLFTGTIADNLRWGNKNATDEELVEACKIACADEFIQTFPDGYNTMLTQGGTNVSGGQKQRLCIARAILKKPKILILDDSTSAVDTKTDRLIRKALKEDIPFTTKIVIAQRISSIEDADQIIIMDNGKIDAIGTHDYLLKTNKIYQEVFYTQNRVGGGK